MPRVTVQRDEKPFKVSRLEPNLPVCVNISNITRLEIKSRSCARQDGRGETFDGTPMQGLWWAGSITVRYGYLLFYRMKVTLKGLIIGWPVY